MAKYRRWLKAQEAELDFIVSGLLESSLDAQYWENVLIKDFSFGDRSFWKGRVIEIGCGIKGMIHFVKGAGLKVGVDPLALAFKRANLSEFPGTIRLCAMGETLPFQPNSFDRAIIYNVLDHTNNPRQILKETFRILRPGSKLLFSLFAIAPWVTPIRWILDLMDREHPFHLTLQEAVSMIKSAGFEVVRMKTYKRRAYRLWSCPPSSSKHWKHLGANLLHYSVNCIAVK